MKEFDNLIANAKISETQDYRYFEKFAKQLNFKDLAEKDIETIKQLKEFIQTIIINNNIIERKNIEAEEEIKHLKNELKSSNDILAEYGEKERKNFDDIWFLEKQVLQNTIKEQEETIKQLVEDLKKSDKTIVVDVTDNNKDEATKKITKLMMQIHPRFRKRIADILFKHRLQFKNYRKMIKEAQTINKQLIKEKEDISRQLIDQQTINKQLTINSDQENERIEYYIEKETRREKEHQVCIDKIKELQEEIESFKKGSLAVKLNEVTKERNEAVFELGEKKDDIIRFINTIDDLKEKLKEVEKNREQLMVFNKNYQEDIRKSDIEIKNLNYDIKNLKLEIESLEKRRKDYNGVIAEINEKYSNLQRKLKVIMEVIDL